MQISFKKTLFLFLTLFLASLLLTLAPEVLSKWVLSDRHYATIEPERFMGGGTSLAEIRTLSPSDEKRERVKAKIDVSEISALRYDEMAIYISRLNGEGYRVYFNDVLIGSVGDIVEGRANIWNSSHVFVVDGQLIGNTNTLEIEIYHQYERGITGSVILTEPDAARWINGMDEVAISGFTMIGMGFVLSGCILILLMGMPFVGKPKPHFILTALALLSLMLYSIDYLPLMSLPCSYLTYKKIIMLFLFLCVSFTGWAIGFLFNRRSEMFLVGGATVLAYAAVAAICQDIISFKQAYDVLLLLLPVNIVIWMIVLLPQLRKSDEAKAYFIALLFTGLFSVYAVIRLIAFSRTTYSSPFIIILIYMCLVFILHTLELTRKDVEIAREIKQRSFFYQQSIRDGLTGLYKSSYLVELVEKISPPYAVAMIDGDNFKQVNDKYGHQSGDQALVKIAEALRLSVREKDLAARFGGDEFLVLLRDCSVQGAVSSMERFRARVENMVLETDSDPAAMTVSIGICHSQCGMTARELIAQADKALYRAKQAGRNRICIVEMTSVPENQDSPVPG